MVENQNDEPKKDPSVENPETSQNENVEERVEETSTTDEKDVKASEETVEAKEEAPKASEEPVQKSADDEKPPEETKDEDEHHDDEDDPHSDEHEEDDQYAGEHDDLPDYNHQSNAELIKAAEHWSKQDDMRRSRSHVEAIRTALLKRLDAEREEKKEEFLEGGGVEIDFHYDQPDRDAFRRIYREYKEKRRNYRKKLEEELQLNLQVKKNIIETIKVIPESEGSAQEKYKQFRDLQDRWKNTGPVPRSESRDLYNNYHFHVDQFYDFLRISNELRELDFKKNQAAKEELIEHAEKLAESEVNPETFATLQRLHKAWKEIGPVERDIRDAMWEKFSEATKKIHEKRHQYYEDLKASRQERLDKKREFVDKMEAMDLKSFKTHRDWQGAIKEMNALRDAFKNQGRINLPGNDALWERYSEINRNFNRTKNAFYKELKKEQRVNLEAKKALLDRAEELKDSTDWRNTANELKRLQREWKKTGFAPRAESDKIWNAFRAACNHFFERLKSKNSERDEEYEGHLTDKEKLYDKVEKFDPKAEKNGIKELKKFIDEWKAIGPVPRDKREIENKFNALLDKHFKAMKVDKKESAMIRFENRVQHIAQDGDQRAMDKEADFLRRKIDEATKELRQLENNMGFFAHSDPNNPLVKEANRNIERQKEQIELLKEKLRLLRKIDAEVEESEEQEQPAAEDVQESKEEGKAESDSAEEEKK